jgi:hypothetical protein
VKAAPKKSPAGWERHKRTIDPDAQPPHHPIPVGHGVRGLSTLVDADGRIRAQWVKSQKENETREQALARLLTEIPKTVKALPKIPGPNGVHYRELLAVYPMGDPHFGMLAWKPETGADFDLKIAEDLLNRAISDLVMRGPRTERALLINLGDFFHSDNAKQTTTAGTPLDSDGRWTKTLQVGMNAIVHTIEVLARHHERVDVDCQIGNHDEYSSMMLAVGLEQRFRATPRIRVSVDPASRHYHTFGRNLIGTTHGDRAKMDDLPSIMAAERPKEWGQSDHRIWYVGHVHHQSLKDHRGCRVETFRTLAARDQWHAAQGYSAPRDMQRITLHSEHGEIARETASVGWLLR